MKPKCKDKCSRIVESKITVDIILGVFCFNQETSKHNPKDLKKTWVPPTQP